MQPGIDVPDRFYRKCPHPLIVGSELVRHLPIHDFHEEWRYGYFRNAPACGIGKYLRYPAFRQNIARNFPFLADPCIGVSEDMRGQCPDIIRVTTCLPCRTSPSYPTPFSQKF